jgi:hypothetical protein
MNEFEDPAVAFWVGAIVGLLLGMAISSFVIALALSI